MLLYGASKEVAAWTAKQFNQHENYFDPCQAIGIVRDNQLIAGVIYNNQKESQGKPYMLEMTVASIDKRWATRHNLKALFQYPFTELDLRRVNTQCDADNEGTIMFNKRLGFKVEGKHPGSWPDGREALSLGMLREECPWL